MASLEAQLLIYRTNNARGRFLSLHGGEVTQDLRMNEKIPRACAHENANGSIAANQGVNVRGFNNKRAASGSGCSGDPCSLVLMDRLPPREPVLKNAVNKRSDPPCIIDWL